MKRLLAAAGLALVASVAYAHGAHKWVQEGGYRSLVDHTLCCGENDCHHIAREDIRNVNGQWSFVLGGVEWQVPPGEVQWGEDGEFSACIWGGKVKCFFIPPQGV